MRKPCRGSDTTGCHCRSVASKRLRTWWVHWSIIVRNDCCMFVGHCGIITHERSKLNLLSAILFWTRFHEQIRNELQRYIDQCKADGTATQTVSLILLSSAHRIQYVNVIMRLTDETNSLLFTSHRSASLNTWESITTHSVGSWTRRLTRISGVQ